MTQRLDEQVGHGMVQVARIDNKSGTDNGRQDKSNLLKVGHDFLSVLGSFHGNLSIRVVGSKTNAFNEGAFRRGATRLAIEQVVNHVAGATSANIVNLVAHVAICVEGWWIVLNKAQ